MLKWILPVLAAGFMSLSGMQLSGTGFGETAKGAKYAALADLSQNIKSEVRSKYIYYKEADRETLKSGFKADVTVSSHLPILGAEFELFDRPDIIEAHVFLSPDKTRKLYRVKLSTLYGEIGSLRQAAETARNNTERAALLERLLEKVDEYGRYRSVALALDAGPVPEPPVNRAEVESRILKLQSRIDSVEQAASVLAGAFRNYRQIYLYPPRRSGSHEITPFAGALKLYLQERLDTVTELPKAKYLLVGTYALHEGGMVLNYTLLESRKRETVVSKSVTLPEKAYRGYRAEPKTARFDELLHEGVVLSHDLRVSVSTNKGSDDLLFTQGEEVEILVKLNRQGYFYIVGYTETSEERFSYLLDLSDEEGTDAFVQFVGADDANRWISLGTFTVEPPFGTESLQVIASNKKFTRLPPHRYDPKSGYYVIGKRLKDALFSTRGLMKKKQHRQEVAEAVLMFTTMRK